MKPSLFAVGADFSFSDFGVGLFRPYPPLPDHWSGRNQSISSRTRSAKVLQDPGATRRVLAGFVACRVQQIKDLSKNMFWLTGKGVVW